MRVLFLLLISGQAWGQANTQCPIDLQKRAQLANPCTALESEKREIAGLVAEGVAAADLAKIAERKVIDAKAAGDKETEYSQIQKFKNQRRLAEDKFNESLVLTAKYYNFRPKDTSGTKIQGGPIKGQPATWRAKYYENKEHFRKVPAPDGYHYLRIKPIDSKAVEVAVAVAVTKDDGEIAVRESLFRWINDDEDKGVDLLAVTLYHETAHYNILISSSPPKTWIEHELAAKEAELGQMAVFGGNGHLEWYKSSLNEDFARYRDAIANPQGKDPHFFDSGYETRELEAANKHEYEKEERRQAGLKQYEESLRQEVEKLTSQRKAEEEARRRKTEEMERYARWSALKLWTLYACSYIRGVRYGDPEWGDPVRISALDQFYQEYIGGHFVVLDRTELDEGLKKGNFFPGDVGSCQKQFVTMLRDLPGPVDLDWLLGQIQYEKRGGRVGELIRGILGALRGDSTGIDKSASRPSSGESSPDSRREGEERRGGGVDDLDGEAWRQLRGIAVRDWKK